MLNVAAVAFALASFVLDVGNDPQRVGHALIFATPTLVLGAVWASLLRWKRTLGNGRLRVGWIASIPLAAGNAGLSAIALLPSAGRLASPSDVFSMFALGVTFGAIIWIPALLLTLLFFGVPLAWAERRAREGLAGAERGERIVGLIAAFLGWASIGISLQTQQHYHRFEPITFFDRVLFLSFAIIAIASGLSAAAIATWSDLRRRRFVREVEAGKREGYRIDPSAFGKVLVRVSSQGEGYRVADVEEELFGLDEAGVAKHARNA